MHERLTVAGVWLGSLNVIGQAAAPYVNTRADIVSVIPHLDAVSVQRTAFVTRAVDSRTDRADGKGIE